MRAGTQTPASQLYTAKMVYKVYAGNSLVIIRQPGVQGVYCALDRRGHTHDISHKGTENDAVWLVQGVGQRSAAQKKGVQL